MPPSPTQPTSSERVLQRSPIRSRMASVQENVRSLLRASLYSNTPSATSPRRTPKLRVSIPSLRDRFRSQSREDEIPTTHVTDNASHTSELYAPPTEVHDSTPLAYPIPPAPAYTTRIVTPHDDHQEEIGDGVDSHSLAALVQDRTRRRHRKAWKRRRGASSRHGPPSRKRDPKARALGQAALLSGLLLAAVLSLYLSLALTNRQLGQEIDVLFILLILTITIFFAHVLIRLCLHRVSRSRRSRHRHHHNHSATQRIPSMTGPEGFRPESPIRVHLQRDEELGPASEFDTSPEIPSPATPVDNRTFDGLLQKTSSPRIEGPPPAYGLWRSSVRADPNLLHWQRNPNPVPPSPNPTNLSISITARSSPAASPHPGVSDGAGTAGSDAAPVPRPPSYVSEDGVAYVVDAIGRQPEMVQRAR